MFDQKREGERAKWGSTANTHQCGHRTRGFFGKDGMGIPTESSVRIELTIIHSSSRNATGANLIFAKTSSKITIGGVNFSTYVTLSRVYYENLRLFKLHSDIEIFEKPEWSHSCGPLDHPNYPNWSKWKIQNGSSYLHFNWCSTPFDFHLDDSKT